MDSSRPDTSAPIVAVMVQVICLILLTLALSMMMMPLLLEIIIRLKRTVNIFRPFPDPSRRCHDTNRYQRTAPSFNSSSVMGTSGSLPPVPHPHEHGGQNESIQEYGNVHEESIQFGSPAAFSTDMGTDNSTAIPTTATPLDGELVCGLCEEVLIEPCETPLDGELVCGLCKEVLIEPCEPSCEPPCETPSKIQEQIDSDDYPDTDISTAVMCGQLNNIPTTATALNGELVCGQCENVLIEPPCEMPSKIQEQIEAVVADVPSDTSNISDDELLDRDDR